jgi:hypothetical protein
MIEKATVYVCGVTAQHEIGQDRWTRVYSKVKTLEKQEAYAECGIAEYEMTFVRWVKPQGDLRKGARTIAESKLTQIEDLKKEIAKKQALLVELEAAKDTHAD